MSFFPETKKKKVACHQTLLVYLPSLCAVLLPLFSNCFIKKIKNKGKFKWQTDCGVALQTWHGSERGWLCTGLPAWTINQGDSMCTVLMRSHTMQIVTTTENKGWEQHVFVLLGTICLHLNSPHVTYKKQSNQGTQQRPIKIEWSPPNGAAALCGADPEGCLCAMGPRESPAAAWPRGVVLGCTWYWWLHSSIQAA